MVHIREQLVQGSSKLNSGTNPATSITVHETANKSVGANAAAHANLQSRGNVRNASWHLQVDDREAVRSFPNTARCWHAGDGSGPGNNGSVAIEICVNQDGDYGQALRNAAELVAQLRRDGGIPRDQVFQHGRWSGKNCPAQLRSGAHGIDWSGFLGLVDQAFDGGEIPAAPPAPGLPPTQGHTLLDTDGIWGGDTTSRAQLVLGTPIDGEIWYQYPKHRQPGLTSGWVWNWERGCAGSPLIKALQRGLGIDDDGVAGPEFWTSFQSRMGTWPDGEIWRPSPAVREFQIRLNRGTW